MSLTKASYSMITGAPTNILDWIPVQYHAQIAALDENGPALETYIQAAMDSGAGSIYFPQGYYIIESPLYITNDVPGLPAQAANLTFVGENRTSTYIACNGTFTPSSIINPATSAGIISMFINQSNNGKFSLKNLRFQGNLPAGHVMYSFDMGTISSTTTQCLFSGVIEDCWFSLGSTNAGTFYGGLQNYVIANNTFETQKSCFRLVGLGTVDLHFTNNSTFFCYDGFISAAEDSSYKRIVNVSGLNVYGYYRGPVISATTAENWHISNVTLQTDDVAPLGDIGLFEFNDSYNITIDGFSCYNGGATALDNVMIFNGTDAKISNGFIGPCGSGIYMSGNNASNLTFDNIYIEGASVCSFWHPSGNVGGVINVMNCSWYNSSGGMFIDQAGSATYALTFQNSSFLNAGFSNTSAGTRNFSINTSGNVNFYNCLIGRTSTDAIAAYYIEASGTGDFVLTDCTFTALAAPTGDFTGAQVKKIAGGLGNRYRQYYASAAPTTGTWSVGDRVFNSVPSVGQPKGWLCTVAGTPGTWVSEGNL